MWRESKAAFRIPGPPMRKSLHSREYQTFLSVLRSLREEAGLTQVELAKRLKQPQSFVSKCENGERRLDVLELRHWCLALSADLVDVIRTVEKKLTRRSR